VTEFDDVAIRPLQPGDADDCDAVIASLPDFFGVDEGIAACAQAVRNERGAVAATANGPVVAFATWCARRPHAAEITWAAVRADHRGGGIGGRVVSEVERQAADAGIEWMVVMTVSPNDARPETYEPTRHFWEAAGYTQLLDFDVWSSNLAVLMVKALEHGADHEQ
jgi:GNAT superfamily N-acetyltransferase